jgi:signal transduction histidine kinase
MLNIDKNKIRILIVDDTLKNIQVLGTVLKNEGYQINVAQNGVQAVKLAQQILPDLILLDVMMPEMDGFQACEEIKKIPETADIPIVFLTARTETESIVRGFELGAVDYVTKPFNAAELLVRVHTHLSLKYSKDLLESVNKERKELLHILCHDLANPMNSIISVLSVMNDSNSEKLQGFLLEAAQQGLDIINMVRQMRALEEHKLQFQAVNLKKILTTAYNLLHQRFKEKNLTLRIDIDDDLFVYVEEVSFANSVVNNLLTNAIKFSYTGNTIHVKAKHLDAKQLILSFEDTGIGMPETLVNNLFDVSKTTSREGTQGEQGTGFGMPLVKKFMLAYGGDIDVQSKAEREYPADHGTCITLILPIASATAESEPANILS